MRLSERGRARFAAQPVARMARLAPDGTPRVQPITFVLDGDRVVTAVDHKPKTTTALARLRDIERDPAVSVVADHYEEDWARLWWVRADGLATVTDAAGAALDLLADKYAQYRERRPEGPVIVVEVARWSEWSATP